MTQPTRAATLRTERNGTERRLSTGIPGPAQIGPGPGRPGPSRNPLGPPDQHASRGNANRAIGRVPLPPQHRPCVDAPANLFRGIRARDHVLEMLGVKEVSTGDGDVEPFEGVPGQMGVKLGVTRNNVSDPGGIEAEGADEAKS